MLKDERRIDPIPDHFSSIEEASDFWDTHSLGDYWEQTEAAHFDMEVDEEPRYIVLEREVARQLDHLSVQRKVPSEVIVIAGHLKI